MKLEGAEVFVGLSHVSDVYGQCHRVVNREGNSEHEFRFLFQRSSSGVGFIHISEIGRKNEIQIFGWLKRILCIHN